MSLRRRKNQESHVNLREPAAEQVLGADSPVASLFVKLRGAAEAQRSVLREINQVIRGQKKGARIVLLLTSNSEKNLPNAFLRRCVYYHIPFPDSEKLKQITRQRLQIDNDEYNAAIEKAIAKFEDFRKQAINKRPATSEFLDWMNILKEEGILSKPNWEEEKSYKPSLSAIVKSNEDLNKISS